MGAEVEVFSLTPDNASPLIETRRFVKHSNPVYDKLFPYTGLIESVNGFTPDIIYFRYSLPNATFKVLQKIYPSVIEVNSDDKEEYKKMFTARGGLKNFLLWQINSLLRGSFLKRADGLVSVTNELSRKKAFTRYNSNIAVIPNSFTLTDKILKKKSTGEELVKLFFIGSPGLKWHGIDKLLKFAEKYKEIEIHIVGLKGENRKNVCFHGYLPLEKYLKILADCHICVGTLSLHKKQMNEACTLKVREYLSYGFPVVLGYKDTAFLKDKPDWILEVPNNETSFNDPYVLESIYKFCLEYKNYTVSMEDVKPYISSEIIESKRLDFMKKVINRASG